MEQQYKTDAEIYAVLEREIIDLTIRPGSSLSENPLCARFGAPRSLIRVVLQKLQENGLVRIVPYKGTTVTRLNRRIVDELIYNLCDNAIKYNRRDGEVEVTVSRGRNGRAVVSVADTGIGIAKEDQERIFERFYRVDKSHSRETGGTGLGLSIVKHGAILHDAKIKIESTLGTGTKIILEF